MPAEISWFREPDIVCWQYRGVVTLQDVEDANSKVAKLLEGVNHHIYILLDLNEVENLDFSIRDASARERPPAFKKILWTLYVGPKNPPIFMMIASALAQKTGAQMRYYETQAEALAFIAEGGSATAPK